MHLSSLRLKLAALLVLACSMLAGPATGAASAASCDDANAYPGDATRQQLSRATVCLLNKQRTSRGLHELKLNPRLSWAARAHSQDMVEKRYFDHFSKAGKDVVDRLTHTGYLGDARTWVVGENLAWGSGERSTPRQIIGAWMHSAGHRQNILTSRFREIGIGVVFETPTSVAARGATYTTTFGARG